MMATTELVLLGWIHLHPKGHTTYFSCVDVHSHFKMHRELTVNPIFFGIVVPGEVDPKESNGVRFLAMEKSRFPYVVACEEEMEKERKVNKKKFKASE